ncbi:hypothetical protein CDAR_621651 [Caerostris darwini]|uniref:Uncharacterized protein n=1 Tax=Caerostris darwini TaxID=1538125 RepID=A0AAV4P4Q1_9ARAC|nr:hypothetical protein CDAR_621651 [Caerostris darwini]
MARSRMQDAPPRCNFLFTRSLGGHTSKAPFGCQGNAHRPFPLPWSPHRHFVRCRGLPYPCVAIITGKNSCVSVFFKNTVDSDFVEESPALGSIEINS